MTLYSLLVRRILHPKLPWVQRRHSSSTQELAIFNEVLTIIDTVNPMEPALDSMLPFLSPEIVTSIINDPPNHQLGFRFFIWASKHRRFRTWLSRNIILDVLAKENGHELYWQVLNEIKKCNVSISADAITVLIEGYDMMGMAEKGVEAFETMKNFG